MQLSPHFSGRSARLGEAFRLQFDVLGALLLREVYTRFGRQNLGFLWMAAEPLLFIGGVVVGRSLMNTRNEHGIPLIGVVATGYPALVMWRNCIFRSMGSISENYGLLYHRQIQAIDIYFSKMLLEISGVILATLICYTALLLLNVVDWPYDWGDFCLGWIIHIWFAIASGLLVGVLSELSSIVDRVVHVFTYLWLPIGGSFFMSDWLPYKFRDYAAYIPSVSGYEVMRGGYFGPHIHVYYNIPVTIGVLLILSVLGLGLLKVARRRLFSE